MDIPWGSAAARQFVTNVGLITSDGPNGPNVMACEWTHHIAFEPGLILISVGTDTATAENIRASHEFGVSLASETQNVLASIAGGTRGREVNKIGALTELGIEFYSARRIKAPMIAGAAMNAECRVVDAKEIGGQAIFSGETLHVNSSGAAPLVYHGGKYYKIGEQIQKPQQDVLHKVELLVAKYRR